MFVLLACDKDCDMQGFYSVYRNPKEGGVPLEERKLTACIEADHQHISSVVNFVACFLWTSILNDIPLY